MPEQKTDTGAQDALDAVDAAQSLGASASPTACSVASLPEPKVSALRVPPAGAHGDRIEAEHEELLFFASWAHAKLNPTVLTVEERERMDRINAIVIGGAV